MAISCPNFKTNIRDYRCMVYKNQNTERLFKNGISDNCDLTHSARKEALIGGLQIISAAL